MTENPYKLLTEKFLKIFGVFVVIIASMAMIIFTPMILMSIFDKPWTWWTYAFFIPLGITILIVTINLVDWDELFDFDDVNDTFEEYREEQRQLRKQARKLREEHEREINLT